MAKLFYVTAKNLNYIGRLSTKTPTGAVVEQTFVEGKAGPTTEAQAKAFVGMFGPTFKMVPAGVEEPDIPVTDDAPSTKRGILGGKKGGKS